MKKGEDYPGITVVFLCHDGQGNFLLNKRSAQARDENGHWDCGGGGVDLGDTIEYTLQKEIMEEYGAEVLESEFLGFRDVHRLHEGRQTHWIALDFLVLVERAKVKNGEPSKFDAIGWFKLNDFPKPMHSQFPVFLAKYHERLLP